MPLMSSERQVSSDDAVETIEQWFTAHNIRASLTVAKDGFFASVDLFGTRGEQLSSGVGKGPNAIVGAYFEAFENVLLEYQFIASDLVIRPMQDWLNSEDSHPLFGVGALLSSCDDGPLKFWRYQSLLQGEHYLVPEVLVNPYYSEPFIQPPFFELLKRYSSKSGWASGSTLKEALLHAANEAVELHYLSQLYKFSVGDKVRVEFYRVELPRSLSERYALSLILTNLDQVNVILAQTEFGSYFCACTFLSALSPMAFRASSVSYSPLLAIESALFELNQQFELFDVSVLEEALLLITTWKPSFVGLTNHLSMCDNELVCNTNVHCSFPMRNNYEKVGFDVTLSWM
ncbi:YcaO-like family protein [Vibrio sp. 16]|uniref:YcaO-like family protein n=1 Tax=Vibrio sp. 16 TaxID=391586 RepID=UPI00018F1B8D|nr:YcaO-like family protein [Vibrio sp. 16]EED25367.1 hypothetical protein VPMS16_2737 [Vibrio sp. 16]CAK4076576.1 hypothetical protein PVDT1_49 [Vibrio sp. 16]